MDGTLQELLTLDLEELLTNRIRLQEEEMKLWVKDVAYGSVILYKFSEFFYFDRDKYGASEIVLKNAPHRTRFRDISI